MLSIFSPVSLAMLASLMLGTTTAKVENTPPSDEPKAPIQVVQLIDEKTLSDEEFVKLKSEHAGLDSVMMLAIAKCESGLRQFEKDGTLLKSRFSSNDQGLFQIWPGNATTKQKTGYQDLGIDVTTREGNMEYAIYLMKADGPVHWKASSDCHRYK